LNVEPNCLRRYRFLCSAVWMLRTKIRINSSVSFTNASTKRGRSRGTRWIKSNQRQDSRSSLRQILSFCTKSLADSTACASPWFGSGVVPDRILSEKLSRRGWEESDLATRRRSDPGKVAIAARLRKETTLPIKWIAARVQIGTTKGAKSVLHHLAHRQHPGNTAAGLKPCTQLEFQSTV
jgi:hypothetical protein